MTFIDVFQKEEEHVNPTGECKFCSGNLIQMPKHLSDRFKEVLTGVDAKTVFRCEECGSEYSAAIEDK